MRWRFINIAVLIANLCLFGGSVYLNYRQTIPSAETLGRYEFIDLSLSALNLMIAILAIILAVAAFWGDSAIREAAAHKAAEVAERVAREVAQRYADDGDESRMVERYAAFVRQEKERNKNKAKPTRARKPVSRPESAGREEDEL